MKAAIIIGAGPAGLTAAHELLVKTDIKPIIFEMSSDIGGISKTINYKGNYIDIGGHRFYSKSDRVMKWWKAMMPVQGIRPGDAKITNHKKTAFQIGEDGPNPDQVDIVMLIRNRLSRILYLRSFFRYPISLSIETILSLGIIRTIRILFSYLYAVVLPNKDEKTLEHFMINRFGRELYNIFFKDYTEKVWGKKCSDISAEWGTQRIKGLSITKTLIHAIQNLFKKDGTVGQKGTETSLTGQFLYPKFGPGQMWQVTARQIQSKGGELHLNSHVKSLIIINGKVKGVIVFNRETKEETRYEGDFFFSTMPIKELIGSIQGDSVPHNVQEVAKGLPYRDFITVGLLLKKMNIKTGRGRHVQTMIPDHWIYIQERDVKIGRLQIFNNWSSYMVKDPDTVWIGLEYFCTKGDELWNKADGEFTDIAIHELEQIEFIKKEDVLDSTVIRMPKAYPAYLGTYENIQVIREFTDPIENLFLIGRNGMHKYNNQDHSMLTAMTAVENIINGITSKDTIWSINTEQDYQE